MSKVSKRIFLTSLDCAGLAWLQRTTDEQAVASEADKLRMDEGREIHELAREVSGQGVFVMPGEGETAAQRTAELIADTSITTLFEATFETPILMARADILRRARDGWTVVEVKSATDGKKKEHLKDLAYTVMVATDAGLPVSHAALLMLSRDYRLGMPHSEMFVEYDRTADVMELVPDFQRRWNDVSTLVLGDCRPRPDFTLTCRRCDYYGENCIGKGIKDPLFHLPRLSASKFKKLKELGVDRLADIPADFTLTDIQERVRTAIVSGRPWRSPGLSSALDEVEWPACYLDFETTATAYPLLDRISPYQQIPTQYSIHVYADICTELQHYAFLADHTVDDRRRLAERLLADLGEAGSIIVYHVQMERGVLNHLAELFPDLADRLQRCVERLIDLEQIVKDHYVHPSFEGRTSIKRTLPALLGDDPYKTLEIQGGDDASALFARMARGEKSESECQTIRDDLLRYCKQDTLAMVEVHRSLLQAIHDV